MGQMWTVTQRTSEDDKFLKNVDGYTDFTVRAIVMKSNNNNNLLNFQANYRKQLRHEIIHAFMFESGLGANFQHAEEYGHDETMIDWFAYQYPKIKAVFEELGIEK